MKHLKNIFLNILALIIVAFGFLIFISNGLFMFAGWLHVLGIWDLDEIINSINSN